MIWYGIVCEMRSLSPFDDVIDDDDGDDDDGTKEEGPVALYVQSMYTSTSPSHSTPIPRHHPPWGKYKADQSLRMDSSSIARAWQMKGPAKQPGRRTVHVIVGSVQFRESLF